jgi:hypothetical protein
MPPENNPQHTVQVYITGAVLTGIHRRRVRDVAPRIGTKTVRTPSLSASSPEPRRPMRLTPLNIKRRSIDFWYENGGEIDVCEKSTTKKIEIYRPSKD